MAVVLDALCGCVKQVVYVHSLSDSLKSIASITIDI